MSLFPLRRPPVHRAPLAPPPPVAVTAEQVARAAAWLRTDPDPAAFVTKLLDDATFRYRMNLDGDGGEKAAVEYAALSAARKRLDLGAEVAA